MSVTLTDPQAPTAGGGRDIVIRVKLSADEPAAARQALPQLRRAIIDGAGGDDLLLDLALAELLAGNAQRGATLLRQIRQARPDWDTPVLRQAAIMERGGDRAGAEAGYWSALARAPESVPAALALSRLLTSTGRAAQALAILQASDARLPGRPALRSALVWTALAAGRPAMAAAALRQAPLDEPGMALAATAAALATGDPPAAETHAKAAIARAPRSLSARRALATVLPYVEGISAYAVRRAAERASRRPPGGFRGFAVADPSRIPHLCVLSLVPPELTIEPLLASGLAAMRSRMMVTVLAPLPAQRSAALAPLLAGDRWRDPGADPARIAALIRDAAPDVLLVADDAWDPRIMAALERSRVPVTLAFGMSQPHSPCVPGIDAVLTDPVLAPPGIEVAYAEPLLRLPLGAFCYAPPDGAPPLGPPPMAGSGQVTFGTAGVHAQMTGAAITAFAQVLHAVPGSRLRMRTPSLSEPATAALVRARFSAARIPGSRLLLEAGAVRPEPAFYLGVDVLLDPMPVSNATITLDALHMGVPVITTPANAASTRRCASVLHAAGLHEFIADGVGAYAQRAAQTVRSAEALAGLRGRLRAHLRASGACDAARFARTLDAALRPSAAAMDAPAPPATHAVAHAAI